MTLHPHHVAAIIERASSGAALAAMGADIRRVMPGTRIKVHGTSADLTHASADILRETALDVVRFDELATEITGAATGRSHGEVADWRRPSTQFTPREAIAAGLSHEIVGVNAE